MKTQENLQVVLLDMHWLMLQGLTPIAEWSNALQLTVWRLSALPVFKFGSRHVRMSLVTKY